ncbi:MAG: hypothetical protein ABIQ39_15655 [Ilumatobacteraceae bacterium]
MGRRSEVLREQIAKGIEDLPDEHLQVLSDCVSECWRNVENSDVHTYADIAADIARYVGPEE